METINEIINTTLDEFRLSIEICFIDPNNTNIAWFNDYYKEDAEFEEVYNRYLEHPLVERVTSQEAVLFYLYQKDKDMMFDEMYSVIGVDKSDKHAIEEIASEIESICEIPIGSISVNGVPTESDVTTTWAIGVDGELVLKSPYMNNTECLKTLYRIIDGLQSRFFMTGYGALKIHVIYNNGAFSQLNWFKGMVMFDYDYVVEYLLNTPDHLRHYEANRLVKTMPVQEAKRFITMFISKIKDSNVEVSLSKLIIELSKNEKFISDKKGIITWFGRIVFLLYVVSNKDFLRQEYIDKLKSILKRTGIKK